MLAEGKDPLPPDELKSAAEEICTGAWHDFANRRFAAILGAAIWQQIEDAWRPSNCQDLAALARQIETIKKETEKTVHDAATGACRTLGVPPPVGEAVGLLVGRIHMPWSTQLDNIAYSIRMIGVFKCVVSGRYPADCACLKDLSAGVTKDQLKALIAQVARDVED
jgi:hypothetical protein